MGDPVIETERLILRQWREADADAMHAMGQDARVMAYLGPLYDRAAAERLVAGRIVNQSLFGYCFWPIERRADGMFLGFCGLQLGPKGTPIEGGIEIGWRLAHHAWGYGYAREAAEATLAWGWDTFDMGHIAAMTVPMNTRSGHLMEWLGMRRVVNEDFDHPDLAEDDPLRRHIYKVIKMRYVDCLLFRL
ncbi:GNAT family N-acetyltransferase [uncultured Sphingomonas sp.]|uniref:GNAT family N-acetyltransferase n=1 Tax=uncultured Sphingomonas sp. TaxID=158754 RepID=UPI0035CAB147